MEKTLSELLLAIKYNQLYSDKNPISDPKLFNSTIISGLAFDSRDVKNGYLFFALPGTHTTGNMFIPSAIKAGAAAVIYQDKWDDKTKDSVEKALKERGENVAFINVDDARYVMAPVSSAFYDNPSSKLGIIGVTGTEGKSSTVSFIWQLLRLTGHKAGFISTVQYSLGEEAIANPQHQTTPEAPIIQRQLYEMVQNGCEYAVVESSSHGLSVRTNRTGCLMYDCGVFMNVTLEHLEFHKTFEQYRDDKANLFRKLDEHNHKKIINGKEVTVPAFGIVNLEDPSARYFINVTKSPVLGFTTEGKAGKGATINDEAQPLPALPDDIPVVLGRNIASARFGLTFDMSEPGAVDEHQKPLPRRVTHIKTSVPGAFNAYNIMAAVMAVSRLTGTPVDQVAVLTSKLESVKGRMTVIDEGQPFELIVDYAHTPSSFETIFPPVRRRCSGRMIALFGSGGERDTEKRPLQGEVAARYCDTLILTDEDPRGEDPVELLQQIAKGAVKQGKIMDNNLFIIHDRPQAIRQALKMAQKDDIVLLLGKSHENSIIYKDYVMPYDEMTEARKALAELGWKK